MFYKTRCCRQSGESRLLSAGLATVGGRVLGSAPGSALQGHGSGALQVLHHQ